ncbi:hypothetical protein U5801_11770 [Lamprobacter modestohalophilus]|uniref:hypothetical protein n=1 Tax=Lamprobacter modestohalophilus TaxID=1064514 RepID=UPI002ADEC4B9|nr:hypothetical protein [Lamprobacter modestohalophilus]MEA1050482.1 hypothetical protein [Lamprobacter modestohalophilus]
MTDTTDDLLPFEAELTDAQLEKGESVRRGWHAVHKLSLAVLTRDSDQLLDAVNDEERAEAFLQLLEHLKDYIDWRRHESDLLASAFARLAIVLQHCPMMPEEDTA